MYIISRYIRYIGIKITFIWIVLNSFRIVISARSKKKKKITNDTQMKIQMIIIRHKETLALSKFSSLISHFFPRCFFIPSLLFFYSLSFFLFSFFLRNVLFTPLTCQRRRQRSNSTMNGLTIHKLYLGRPVLHSLIQRVSLKVTSTK